MSPNQRWQPLLYGRTARADRWWRLRPFDVSLEWLNAVVVAGTGGGEGLADQARFLMARQGPLILVAVACRADSLSDTMNSDGSRRLYTLVGWVSRAQGAPDWDTFTSGWRQWATDVYQAWMPLDWNKHRTDLGDGHESPYCDAPWPAAAAAGGRDQLAPPPGRGGDVILVPADSAPAVWSGLAKAGFDFAFAAGFDRPPANANGALTHAAVRSMDAPPGRPDAVPSCERAAAPDTAEPAAPQPGIGPEATEPLPPSDAPVQKQQRWKGQETPARTGNPPEWESQAGLGNRPEERGAAHPPVSAERPYDKPQREHGRESALGRIGGKIRNLIAGEPENGVDASHDAPEHTTESAQPEEPEDKPRGPLRDLDYWAQQEKPKRSAPRSHRKDQSTDEDYE